MATLPISPAQYSKVLLDPIASLYRTNGGVTEGTLLDPFAGLGQGLTVIAANLGLEPLGYEIEPGYFIAKMTAPCVRLGDSRSLPLADCSVQGAVTSPAYPNGVSDSFHSADLSKRHCLAQDERILTRDLRWVPCGDLGEGDEIMGFDEDAPNRKWHPAVVTASEEMEAECVRVHLEDGTSVVCTDDHPWLARRSPSSGTTEWVRADALAGVRRRYVLRALTPWTTASTYDAGWLAGMLDGEGCLSQTAHGTAQLVLVQAKGPLMDRCSEVANSLGFSTNLVAKPAHRDGCKEMASLYFTGRCQVQALMPVLGSIRPTRLLERWDSLSISPGIHGHPVEVVSVERVGKRAIQSIATSSGTYVGEGFLMHNTYVHRLRGWLGMDYELQPGNAGGMNPRRSAAALEAFYDIHRAVWEEMYRVLEHGALFIVNTKDTGKVPFRYDTEVQLVAAGFEVVETCTVSVRGLNHGKNHEHKIEFEDLTVVRKP